MKQDHQLILGGARSGKSSFAEEVARSLAANTKCNQLYYVATAVCCDNEMRQRVERHQKRRGDNWREYEVPLNLASKLAEFNYGDIVLVDCLTLWLNNVIFDFGESASNERIEREVACLTLAIETCKAKIVFVSNEVGLGIVPLGQVSRLFVDNAGRMNQAVAKVCSKVTFIAAGLPLALKPDVA